MCITYDFRFFTALLLEIEQQLRFFLRLKRLYYRSMKIGIAIHFLTISEENALFEGLLFSFIILCNREISAEFFQLFMKILCIAIVQKIPVA